MTADKNDVFYVGNKTGVDDVEVLNKSTITKNLVIPSDSNALMVGALTVSGTIIVDGTLVIV